MKKALLLLVLLLVIFISLKSFVKTNPQPTMESSQASKQTAEGTQIECSGIPTPSQTEGPYYKTVSPKRNNIAENTPGVKLIVTGYVFNKDCIAIANAWLDFWQADSSGAYDNNGYALRGHQFTDENGMYRLETIVPAEYGSRPPHIHVKVKSSNGPILTSQLYFPNASQNKTDPIFNQALIINIAERENIKIGTFNFVLNE